ncbi:MAG: hypothetical protein JWM41_4889 [Gemmatimonadetes bacterium]|nr:hypothetical protein [Gemmatimonadota bacterium]
MGLGRAWGAFRPGLGYELVQPVFRLFADAVPRSGSPTDDAMLARYHKSRDALALALFDAEGHPIHMSAVHIADYTVEEGPAALELDVLIKDDAYWARRTASPSPAE